MMVHSSVQFEIKKDKKLNLDFYDKKSRLYKKIQKDNLDYTTILINELENYLL